MAKYLIQIAKNPKSAAKMATKLIGQFSTRSIDDAVAYAMKNKVIHVFGKAAHNLDPYNKTWWSRKYFSSGFKRSKWKTSFKWGIQQYLCKCWRL